MRTDQDMRNLWLAVVLCSSMTVAAWPQEAAGNKNSSIPAWENLPDAPRSKASRPAPVDFTRPGVSRATLEQPPADSTAVSLAGVHAKLSLVSPVSSKLPTGSRFEARLDEPVTIDGQIVLPQGTLLEGRLQTVPGRLMMRRGSVFMMFEKALLPNGAQPVALSVVFTDSRSAKADTEGTLHPTLSKKRLVIQLGGAFLVAKLADDLSEVAGGTGVGAGSARYYGLGAAAAFLLIQKGREVKLRAGDKIEVEFGHDGPALPLRGRTPETAPVQLPNK